jgi:lipopolysaccharide transport system ATP-binding protein
MARPAIRVEGLGKHYGLRPCREPYQTLRDTIAAAARRPLQALRSRFSRATVGAAPREDRFWAVRDVCWQVEPGEAWGIIGRNGAGKSTLLKILSRITEPSQGFAEVAGRVGSLLEVGTGFHPELTGSENVLLNGAILGMSHAEIRRRFDRIVAFAEVDKFMDTPVKYYSTGMYLRLAFAVAAHLEPDILLVDEVLAVGDAVFQNKCLGKMSDVAGQGRTVLFVSHNLTAVSALCGKVLWLDGGRVAAYGPAGEIIRRYLSHCVSESHASRGIAQDELFELREFGVSQDGRRRDVFFTHLETQVHLQYELKRACRGLRIGFDLIGPDGQIVWRSFDDDLPREAQTRNAGRFQACCVIPPHTLAPSQYTVCLVAKIHNVRWITRGEIHRPLAVHNVAGLNRHYPDENRPGLLLPRLEWQVNTA